MFMMMMKIPERNILVLEVCSVGYEKARYLLTRVLDHHGDDDGID